MFRQIKNFKRVFGRGIAQNIEIERLKKEDKSKKKYFRDILSVVPAVVYWKNLKGEYLGCNKKMSDLIGFSSVEQIIGLDDFQMPWAEHAECYRERDLQIIRTGKIGIFEDRRVDAKGLESFWLTRKEPLRNEEGDIVGVIGATVEVTAQKEKERLEREKIEQEKQELKRKLEAEEEFRKIVLQANHDIGSPLLVLDLFAKKYLEFAPEEQRNSVRNSISRIRGIASSMLVRFSEDSLKKFNGLLFPILAEVVSEKHVEFIDSKINIILNIESKSCFAFFSADSSAFKRMMSNIINNSADALLEMNEREICIDVTCSHGTISISISDNGCGMSESVKQKILKGVSITSGKQDGYGLGYLQIRQTVTDLEGTLEIQSSEGHGTSILLTFPVLKLPDYIASVIKPHPCDTIIVVDDDPSIHEALDLRFADICQSVKHFTQGEEALQYLTRFSEAQKEFTCLLSDYELLNQPINGIELIEKLKIRKSILVTSHHENQDVIEQVKKKGIKLLPKIWADKVPIVLDCDYKNCSNNVFKI